MAKLLLNLRNVPDDEADEVRDLLDANQIEYYETRPSLWGVSAGGIWVRPKEQEAQALQLLADYQQRRAEHARQARAEELRDGRARSTWQGMREKPLQAAAAVLGILLMIAVATLPFLLFRAG